MKILKNRFGGKIGQIGWFVMNPNTLGLSDITNDTGDRVSSMSSEASNLTKNMKNISIDIL